MSHEPFILSLCVNLIGCFSMMIHCNSEEDSMRASNNTFDLVGFSQRNTLLAQYKLCQKSMKVKMTPNVGGGVLKSHYLCFCFACPIRAHFFNFKLILEHRTDLKLADVFCSRVYYVYLFQQLIFTKTDNVTVFFLMNHMCRMYICNFCPRDKGL